MTTIPLVLAAIVYAFEVFSVPGSSCTSASKINDQQQIVGDFCIRTGETSRLYGFLLENGTFKTIDPPGSTNSTARGINARGHIVGTFVTDDDVQKGYLWDGHVFQIIEPPGSALSDAY